MVKIVCPLCVQWRCKVCKSDEWPMCCEPYGADSEPYWPDGSVAVLTQDNYCERCDQAMADYFEAHKEDGCF
jgi:hypothetical protein